MLSVYVRAAMAALVLLLLPEAPAYANDAGKCSQAVLAEGNARDQMVASGCTLQRNANRPRCRRLYAKIERAKANRAKYCKKAGGGYEKYSTERHLVMPSPNRLNPNRTYEAIGEINRFIGGVIRQGSQASQGNTTRTTGSGECPPGMHRSAQNPVCHYPENQTNRRGPSSSGGASPDQVMQFFMGDFIGR